MNIDKDSSEKKLDERHLFTFIELTIEDKGTMYDCSYDGGGGSDVHMSFAYIVSPPLPDDRLKTNLYLKNTTNHIEESLQV